MTERHLDQELDRRFADLRQEDAARAPAFGAVMERARSALGETPATRPAAGGRAARRLVPGFRAAVGRWPLAAGATALAAAALAAVLLLPGNGDAEFEAAVSSYTATVGGGAWRSPTGGLLQVPGIEVMRSVPSIGGTYAPRGAGRSRDDNG